MIPDVDRKSDPRRKTMNGFVSFLIFIAGKP